MAAFHFIYTLHRIVAFAAVFALVQAHSSNSSNPFFNYIGSPYTSNSPALPMKPNASAELSQPGFAPPDEPKNLGGTWTWTTAVYGFSYLEPNTASLATSQKLWLRTNPEQDLLASNLHYAGCLFALNDLPNATVQAGRSDDGSCHSILGDGCLDALRLSFQNAAFIQQNQTCQPHVLNGTTTLTYQPDICSNVAGNFSLPSECVSVIGTHYNSSSISNAQYAGSALNLSAGGTCNKELIESVPPNCTWNAFFDDPSQPIMDWEYHAPELTNINESYFDYDSAITSITPIISTLFTVDNITRPWSDSWIGCLRPTNVAAGSRKPTSAPIEPIIPSFSVSIRHYLPWKLLAFATTVIIVAIIYG